MDATTAADGLANFYRVLTDLGGLIAGILALLAGIIAYAGALRQAKAGRAAADAQIAAIREQMAQQKYIADEADQRHREDLRFSLAREAARIGELVAHRYRVIPMEYGPGKLETIPRSACDTFKVAASPILRSSPGVSALLDKDIVAAAVLLDDKVDELNSLLVVDGALGRLPAVGLMTALENVTEAAHRLRARTLNGAAPPADAALAVDEWSNGASIPLRVSTAR
jgi:hypothetical protein